MKKNDILVLLIPLLIVVILWVIFSVYHSSISSTIPEDLNMQITSINPNFDTKTIDNLKKRRSTNPTLETQPSNQADENNNLNNNLQNNSAPISTQSANQASGGGELLP